MHLFPGVTPDVAYGLEFLTWCHMALSIDDHLAEQRRLREQNERRSRGWGPRRR